MSGVSEEKREELFELINKQKKAKLNWASTITQISQEDIIAIAPDLGLVVEGDFIMLQSETADGKRIKQAENNITKIVEIALAERVFRSIDHIKATSPSKSGVRVYGTGTRETFRFDRKLNPFAPKDVNIVDTFHCNLDGSVEFSLTRTSEMKPVKDILYKQMIQQSNNNIHYYVPITTYYQLIEMPKNQAVTRDSNLAQKVTNECLKLDNEFARFCTAIINNSIGPGSKGFLGIGKSQKVMLTTGRIIEVTSKMAHLQHSLFLSYRTELNALYYALVQNKQLPEIINFTSKNTSALGYIDAINLPQIYEMLAINAIHNRLPQKHYIILTALQQLYPKYQLSK